MNFFQFFCIIFANSLNLVIDIEYLTIRELLY